MPLMALDEFLDYRPDVKSALENKCAVVALESTIISHGLPWPTNRELALVLEQIVRDNGAVPATIGILEGRLKIGMTEGEVTDFAKGNDIVKVSRRDLGGVLALRQNGATTVAATMIAAEMAGIRVFATGGIGGVHRGAETSLDISADLTELAKTRVAVVCAGAKSILDLPKTLEYLETNGVPVIGYQTTEFPSFHSRDSGLIIEQNADTAVQIARIMRIREKIGLNGGEIIANPIPLTDSISRTDINNWIDLALQKAEEQKIIGKDVTPFLLSQLAELSEGRTVAANLALVKNNAKLAAEIATAYVDSHE
jgi:pseudouridine-5'-phosphate glycosidase